MRMPLRSAGALSASNLARIGVFVSVEFPSMSIIAPSVIAASITLVAMGPAVSCVAAIGTIPKPDTSPWVGLNPTTPLREAGHTIEPSVSLPIATGTYPNATDTAGPELDPQGERVTSNALRVWPRIPLHPEMDFSDLKFAHSLRLAFPSMTAPDSRNLEIRSASRPVRLSANASDPAVVGHSIVSMLSLTSMGTLPSGSCTRSAGDRPSRRLVLATTAAPPDTMTAW